MSTEIERLFASLAADADSAPLAPAEELRTRTDRRARTQRGLALVGLVVVVGGTALGGRWLFPGQGQTVVPEPGTSIAVTASPAPTAPSAEPSTPSAGSSTSASPASRPSIPRSVPDRAFLTTAETRSQKPYTTPGDDKLPELCGATFASDDTIGVRRTVHAIYREPETPVDFVPDGVATHTITVYRGSGAEDFVDELRTAARGCAREENRNKICQHRLLDPPALGDDAVLIERTCDVTVEPGDPGGGRTTARVAVVRIADTVTVLYFTGWEGVPVKAATAQLLTRQAAQRLADWRK